VATTPEARWHLQKWYADCVTPTGGLFVGYLAEVRCGPLRVRYAASLVRDAAGAPVRQRQTLRAGRVDVVPGRVGLAVPALGLLGTWRGGSGTDPATVVRTERGEVTWECLTLDADATVRVRGREFAGPGYAEVVRLTLAPWELGFADLRWGRFIADDRSDAMTWIATGSGVTFVGAWTPRVRFRQEAEVGEGSVLVTGGPELTWGAGAPIRRGTVTRSLLGRLAPLGRLLPRGVRRLEEDKTLSRGALLDGGASRPGWVLHERVRWR